MTISRYNNIVSLTAAVALAACSQQPAASDNAAMIAVSSSTVSPSLPGAAALKSLPQGEQMARAFQAAFGKPAPVSATVDGSEETTTPAKLVWHGDTAFLITSSAVKDGCHACSGSLGIYYLKADGARFAVTGKFPHAVEGQGFGAPPSGWSVSDRFGPSPVLYSEGGYTGQGYTCTSFDLTEFGADKPVKLVTVPIHYDNSDVGDGPAESIDGKIASIEPGKSFTVHYSGSSAFDETYLRSPTGFTLRGRTRMKTC
ncbi:MAG: hypothetical protein ABIS14_00385 [Sphingomonas sp.]